MSSCQFWCHVTLKLNIKSDRFNDALITIFISAVWFYSGLGSNFQRKIPVINTGVYSKFLIHFLAYLTVDLFIITDLFIINFLQKIYQDLIGDMWNHHPATLCQPLPSSHSVLLSLFNYFLFSHGYFTIQEIIPLFLNNHSVSIILLQSSCFSLYIIFLRHNCIIITMIF